MINDRTVTAEVKKDKSPKAGYVKPEIKRHEALNIVQGSGKSYSSSGSYTYYKVILYTYR
jgi:hypothetical protein